MAVAWIKLGNGVYEKAIEAALREQDRLGLTKGALVNYQQAPEHVKRDLERIWKTGFSAVVRAAFTAKNSNWNNLPAAVFEAGIQVSLDVQAKIWASFQTTESMTWAKYLALPEDTKKKMVQVWQIGWAHLVRAWLS